MEFSRPEYWSGRPFPSPGDFPNPGIEPRSSALQADFFTSWETVKHLPTMQKTQVRSLGWEDPLEKGMATHSSILAWKFPWMEEPGGLQSMGSKRVRHFTNTALIELVGKLFLYLYFWNIFPLWRIGIIYLNIWWNSPVKSSGLELFSWRVLITACISLLAFCLLRFSISSLKKKIYLFYFWLHWIFITAHSLCLVAEKEGYSLAAVHWHLIAEASLVEHEG